MTEPHPLRCETCKYSHIEDCEGNDEKMCHRFPIHSQVDGVQSFIDNFGCASHSSNTRAEQVLDEFERWCDAGSRDCTIVKEYLLGYRNWKLRAERKL